MAENKDIQIQVKKIPAFTVLKNNSILKNIILLRNPPPFHTSSINQDSKEEILLVGRHPHCNITLEHPSISRYHLRIHSNPSSQVLSVIDLQSVHGTWVSGKRIEPGVHVNLKEGDTVKLGGSSRIYELHWVPLTQVFDVGDRFIPAVYTIKEGEEVPNQDEKPETRSIDNDLECLNLSSSDKSRRSPLTRSNPLASPVLNFLNSSSDDSKVEHLSPPKVDSETGETFSTFLGRPPIFSGTISAKDFNTPLESENQSNQSRDNICYESELQNHGIVSDDPFLVPNCSKSSNDDMWVEHLSPSKTGLENGEISTTTEALPETEDLSNWLSDNMSNEFELQSHGIIKYDLLSMPNCSNSSSDDTEVEHSSPSKTGHENGELSTTTEAISESEHLSNWSRNNMSDEFKQLSQVNTKVDLVCVPNCSNSSCYNTNLEHSSPMKTGHDIGENSTTAEATSESEDQSNWSRDNMNDEFEQLSHWTWEDDLASAVLYDAIETHEKDALCQDIEKGNEVEMCTGNEPVNRYEGGSFMPERAGNKEVTVDSKVEHDHEITEKESVFVSLPDVTDMDQRVFTPDVSRAEEIHMNPEPMKNASVSTTLFNSSDGNELDIFTPDKENKNPNSKSLGKRWKEDEHKNSNHQKMSKKTSSPAISKEKSYFGVSKNLLKTLDKSNGDEEKFVSDSLLQRSLNMKKEIYPFDHHEVQFSSLEEETESRLVKMEGSCSSTNYPKTIQKTMDSSLNFKGRAKKQWTMVVDTNSLLHNESLKHLKLLQGLKGTQLYVPKIVMRELMNIKCHHGHDLLSKSTKKASLALKWIDECMANTRWWMHVDDEILDSSEAEPEHDEILDSSEAEPEVLKTALHLRKEITDRKIIVLSNDLTLKIKAMAEGVMCEAADEFRRSLVNPFSERFMWVGSSPRGPTWSCIDDDILRRKYQGCGINASHGLKGLRLLASITTFR